MKQTPSSPLSPIEEQIRYQERSTSLFLSKAIIEVKATSLVAMAYSSPVMQPKVFKSSLLRRIQYLSVATVLSFMFVMSLTSGVIFFSLFVGFTMLLLLLQNPWRPSVNKSLTISNEGVLWGTILFTWQDIEGSYIAVVHPGRRTHKEILYVHLRDNSIHRMPLEAIVSLTVHASDIASAIQHFHQRYLRSVNEESNT